ncbi:MAG: phospholipase/carboxylesterase, partial [Planctomycetota bacterium]
KLGGLIVLSTYLVCAASFDEERTEINQSIPIFQAHGKQDPMVPFAQGQKLEQRMKNAEYEVEFNAYNMQHEVVMEEIQAIGRFIHKCLATG